jgi:hypothetical protein
MFRTAFTQGYFFALQERSGDRDCFSDDRAEGGAPTGGFFALQERSPDRDSFSRRIK